MNREELVNHVAERLDCFAAVVAARKLFDDRNGTEDRAVYERLRREHATRIVDAIRVLSQ
jgi:hypothetical protein